jgi:RNA polymerase sigma-70 factor (ECF subfamily)
MVADIEDSLKRDLAYCAKGHQSHFNGVVLVAAPLVRGFVRRYFESDACEDIVQEVFLQIFRSTKKYDPRLSAKSWILGIAHHVIVDEIRRRTRRPSNSGNDLTHLPAIADGTTEIEDLILRLPKEHFDVIYATKIMGLSYEETAAALSIPLGTVKSRIFVARREISEMIYGSDTSSQSKERGLA